MARNRLTLLDVVQGALDAMNHDGVDSISDTIESTQIANEARRTYYDLMDRDDWPHLIKLTNLLGLGDTARPNFMKIPDEIVRIDDVRYEVTQTTDSHRQFDPIVYRDPISFLDRIYTRRTDNTNVITVQNFDGADLFILNDERPYFWTTFDDEHVVFDAYDSAKDTTLQGSKSLIIAKEIPEWTHSDTFVPDMPEQMFSVFQAEVTSAAFTYWKQGFSVKDEQRAARGISRLRKDARKHDEQSRKVKHGRRRPGIIRGSADGVKGSIRAAQF